MRTAIIFIMLISSISLSSCRSTPPRPATDADDYLLLTIYGEPGKVCVRHLLFRDGRVKVGHNPKPEEGGRYAYIWEPELISEAWRLADMVLATVKEGAYLIERLEESRLIICVSARKRTYSTTHDKSAEEAPDSLRKLVVMLHGLSDF